MRIYDLAKRISEDFGINLKSARLAEEIREMEEFAGIRDSIKSHASSVEDDVVRRIMAIYTKKHGKPGETKESPEAEAARLAEEEKRREAIRQRRRQLQDQKQREEAARRGQVENARQAREKEIQRRRAMKTAGGGGPLPAVPRPAPVGPLRPPGPAGNVPFRPRTGVAPIPGPGGAGGAVRPERPPISAPRTPPPPGPAAAASAAPVAAPEPAPAAPPAVTPVQAAPPSAGPATATPGPAPAAPVQRPAGSPEKRGPVAPAPPRAPRPERPRAKSVDTSRMTYDGQPAPPSAPKLGADSPFLRRRPVARDDNQDRPGGRGRDGGTPRERDPRDSREARRDGRPARDPRDTRERGDVRPARGREGGDKESGELVIPEIGVMSMKTGPGTGRRRGDKGVPGKGPAAVARKKGLKQIARDEIEIKPTRVYGLADEFRRPIQSKRGRPGMDRQGGGGGGRQQKKGPLPIEGPVTIGSTLTVGEFAEKIRLPVGEVIKQGLLMGKPMTINQLIDPELCEMIAMEHNIELIVETEGDEQDLMQYRPEEIEENKKPRPPVVTIMGHVDHGKTTLLDAYRSSQVVSGEVGGITQHIGAYHVDTPRGEVIFLDTPGHAAFTAMRARGAQATDIVILVVSADDGVMPQTVEAINHAREAEVPIIVAINKCDLPGANPQRVRTELMQHSILPEELGGENIFVEISAKMRTNLDQLLEMILLQADVLELKADPTCRAEGIIIESHTDPMRGSVATVLVQCGTLRQGDIFVVGTESGRVRGMINDMGKPVREATPAHPVEIMGLTGSPEAGEVFMVMSEERIARAIASRRVDRRRLTGLGVNRHVSLEGLHELVAEGKLKDLKVILKADVQGSVEAISQALVKLSNKEVQVKILHSGTGGITESDIDLADASDAIVFGFHVRPDPAAIAAANQKGVQIMTYQIIYELIEEVEKAITGMLEKRYREIITGRIEIRQIFRISRIGNIAGCYVLDGEVTRNSTVRLVRDSIVLYQGRIESLRRVKEDVTKVSSGFECGITLHNYQDMREGDIIEVFSNEEISLAELVATAAND